MDKYDIKLIDHWDAPEEDGAPLLTMPNIPHPMQGQPPRVIDPQRWEIMRKRCYLNANYTCQASGKKLGRGMYQCLPKGTEVLTSIGWKPIEDVTTADLVAQFTPDTEKIDFVHPTRTVSHYERELIKIGYKKGFQMLMTGEHRVLLFHHLNHDRSAQKIPKVILAKDVTVGKDQNIWVAGYGAGDSDLSWDERLFIALQADGSVRFTRKGDGQFAFSIRVEKERKKAQLKELMTHVSFPYKERPEKNRPKLLGYDVMVPFDCKDFHNAFDITQMSAAKAQSFINELVKWDGWKGVRRNTEGRCYYTTSKRNKDFVLAVASLAGVATHVTSSQRKSRKTEGLIWSRCYNIEFLKRGYRGMQTMVKERIPYEDIVYCLSVPSSFFVVKQEDNVFVTGNCHELFSVDWANHTTTFKRAVCLDARLHGIFIHSGRALTMFERGDRTMPKSLMLRTLEEGFSLIRDWNQTHEEPLRVSSTFIAWAANPDLREDVERLIEQYDIKFYTFDPACWNKKNWSKWKLVWEGREYPTKFANQEEWREFYTPEDKKLKGVWKDLEDMLKEAE